MSIPIRNVYYLLCYAWGQWAGGDLVDAAELGHLNRVEDLLGQILADGTFGLLRRGLDQGYREYSVEMAGVRGKLDVGATAKRALRSRARTVCTIEAFSPDVVHNQILRSTLALLRALPGLHPRVRERVSLAWDRMQGVEMLHLSKGHFRRVQLDRNQRQYRFLLSVCWLVLDSALVNEERGEVRFRDFRRNRRQMWKIFEAFVLSFFQREQSAFRITGQRSLPWMDATGRTPADAAHIPTMMPDVVAVAPHRRIVLDTKFYQSPLAKRDSQAKLRSGHLYQMFAYLHNRQAARPSGPRHEGILLYASAGEPIRVDIALHRYRIQARTVDLSQHWSDVHRELLEILE